MVTIARGNVCQGELFKLGIRQTARPSETPLFDAIDAVGDVKRRQGDRPIVADLHHRSHTCRTDSCAGRKNRLRLGVQVKVRNGRCATWRIQQTRASSSCLEKRIHAVPLALREQIHARIVRIVHVILDHRRNTSLAARRTQRTAVIRSIVLWGVGHEIVHSTAAIAPNVAKVQPVANFMGACSSQVKWSLCSSHITCGGVRAHHAVSVCWTTRELCIS